MQPLFIIRYFLNSENAMFTASELLERINSHIAELQFVRTPQGLYAPVTYVLSMGGKRIRPVLMLMAYNLYQEDITRIFNPATGIEVYHNYTLLHDALMAAAQKIGEKLNQQQAQPGAQQEAPKSQKKDDDVVDADFKEV